MPLKPREQWKPNVKLQTAREKAFGKKSRSRFARAVKPRCQELYGGHCGVDHRTVRRWEEGACEPDACHQQAICDVVGVPWEERDQLGFTVPERKQASPEIESAATVPPGLVIVTDQYADLSAKATHLDSTFSGQLQLGEACVIEHPAIVTSSSGIGLTVALNGSSRLDPELLSDLEALVNIYRRMTAN